MKGGADAGCSLLAMPAAPRLGLEFNDEAIRRFAVA
jgi:hypothetical protein